MDLDNNFDREGVEQLINIIRSADGEPQVIRDMILEGDAIDMIGYILNKAPSTTTWKDADTILFILKELGYYELYNILYETLHGVDIISFPEEHDDVALA